ncbi:MAG TPA: LysM peptidoglycan-binding domain-containing protein [Bacteroidota bacterium]|jgi:nucleoid-associated protein YgaU|nr:LysM peptidoglycan-binding domain-containing protein [Bacteroidota bacterium]
MRWNKIAFLTVALGLFFMAGSSLVFAQQEEMTEEQAAQKIQTLEKRVSDLKKQQSNLDSQIEEKNRVLKSKQDDYERCVDELYALVGATRQDVDAFEARLKRLEGKISDLLRLSPMDLLARKGEVDEAEEEYKSLSGNKISLLPAFYDRVQRVGENIRTLRETLSRAEKTYVVGTWAKDRDCLWNIAKKPDIYGDAFKWPKIWQKNRDQIKNPDIIHPGQVLKIPAPAPLTPEEESAARKYYRQKREAEMNATTTTAPENVNK